MEKRVGAMRRELIFSYAPLLVWVGVIFFLSGPDASMAQTSRFIRPLLELLFPTANEATLQIYHGYIRKGAHVTEYAILAFLAARALLTSSKPFVKRYWWLAVLAVTFAVASMDEFNQSFDPSRTGSIWDILIDGAGGTAGIVVYTLTRRWFGRRRMHKKAT